MIKELETYFNSIDLPKEIRLTKQEYITDVSKFIRSHITIYKANEGKRKFKPYLDRLESLKQILKLRNDDSI